MPKRDPNFCPTTIVVDQNLGFHNGYRLLVWRSIPAVAKQDSSTMGQGRERLETKFRARHRALSRDEKTNMICECVNYFV